MENPIEQIVKAIGAQNLKFEAYSNIESRDTFIGISTKQAMWDWFVGHNYYSGAISMSADHTYNQNIGKSRKSIMHRIKLTQKYKNLLGVEMDIYTPSTNVI